MKDPKVPQSDCTKETPGPTQPNVVVSDAIIHFISMQKTKIAIDSFQKY